MTSGVAIGLSKVATWPFMPALAGPRICTSPGSFGERPHPRERRAKRVGNALAGDRKLESCTDADRRTRRVERGGVNHFGNRRDAGKGFLRKRAQRVRHGACQTPVDVNRAAAHPGDHARVGQRPAFEPGQNEIAPRADDIPQHAEDVDLELFDLVALPHREAGRFHSRFDLIDGVVGGRSREAHDPQRQAGDEGEKEFFLILSNSGTYLDNFKEFLLLSVFVPSQTDDANHPPFDPARQRGNADSCVVRV